MNERITTLKAGTRVWALMQTLIKPRCGFDIGHWYCATHREHFDSPFEKDDHISKGKHLMVWCCNDHGLEEP